MYIADEEEWKLRQDLAAYRCLLDMATDDNVDAKLRKSISDMKARLLELETGRTAAPAKHSTRVRPSNRPCRRPLFRFRRRAGGSPASEAFSLAVQNDKRSA